MSSEFPLPLHLVLAADVGKPDPAGPPGDDLVHNELHQLRVHTLVEYLFNFFSNSHFFNFSSYYTRTLNSVLDSLLEFPNIEKKDLGIYKNVLKKMC